MKNIIFIPNIDCGDGRNKPYHYSIKSYKKWAEQYDNIEVVEWTEPVFDTNVFPIIYQREWVFDILDHNDIDYDQILIVDSDTIIHPKCPNFFEKTNHNYSVVASNGCFEWVMRSIDAWSENFFPNEIKPKVWEYFNTGFIIANKKHKPFFDIIKNTYTDNIDELNNIRNNVKYKNLSIPSTGQTIVNFLVKKHNIEMTYLPERYNMTDLFRKNLLHVPGHSWWSDELSFLDAGWIYHFNAIPKNDRHVSYWMKRTYNELYVGV
tara:strand:+ start:362 stop:1153 length:792 start_codon:yes stop_codon:yes gene_type:complete